MDDLALTVKLGELLGLVPGWEWRPDGSSFTVGAAGIFYGAIRDKPDRAVGIRVYGQDDDALVQLRQRLVQLRVRGRPGVVGDADHMASIAGAYLESIVRTAGISGVRRLSFSASTPDGNQRQERTDNYRITLDNLEATP